MRKIGLEELKQFIKDTQDKQLIGLSIKIPPKTLLAISDDSCKLTFVFTEELFKKAKIKGGLIKEDDMLVMPVDTFQVGFTEDSTIKGTINDFLKII